MYESAAAVKPRFANAMRAARARKDTLLRGRREDKALRGRNLSARPEAGHAEEFDSSFSVPDMLGIKAINPKAALADSLLFSQFSPNRSFGCFAENHVCALGMGMSIFVAGFAFTPRLAAHRKL